MPIRMTQAWITALILASVATLTAGAIAADNGHGRERPNILLIMSDDMGFSDLGCYGSEIATPNLDHLAATGLRFTEFYNCCRCCPTRACLLTGLYPHQAGMGHMTAASYSPYLAPGYERNLNDHCQTIAQVLRPAGYATYACGKWHVTCNDEPGKPKNNWPLQRGFDHFYGTIKGGGSYYDPATLCRGNTLITPDNDPQYKPKTFYYTDAIADNAVAFLQHHEKADKGKPFFMYVAFTAAHWPMQALPEDIAKYQGVYDKGFGPIRKARFERLKKMGIIDPSWELSPQAGDWSKVAHKAWQAHCMQVYAAMVDRMDRNIGHIVDELRREGQLDNTLIFFLQDNGGCAESVGRRPNKPAQHVKPMKPDELELNVIPNRTRDGRPMRMGPDKMPGPADSFISYGQDWANVSNTPFREYKHWVHEGGISTPLIVHWPRGIDTSRDGSFVQDPGHIIDIMATCVDVADATYPKQADGHDITPMQGVSLLPTFAGKPLQRGRPIFWEHEGNCAVRDGPWKIVRYGNHDHGRGQAWELHNMQSDRTEMHDLADEHPEIMKRMTAQWEQWARDAHVVPWPWKKITP